MVLGNSFYLIIKMNSEITLNNNKVEVPRRMEFACAYVVTRSQNYGETLTMNVLHNE
jgi:hypothetical protein